MLRWGILSGAKIAREQMIPAILKAEGCRLQAIASRDRDRADGKVSTRASSLLRPVSRRAVRGGSSSGNAGSWNAVSRTRAGRASGRVRGGDSVVDEASELTELVGSNGIAADVQRARSMPPSRSHGALRRQERQSDAAGDQLESGARRAQLREAGASAGRADRAQAPSFAEPRATCWTRVASVR